MKVIILFGVWCVLFVLCWPLALIGLFVAPLIWLISIPLMLLGLVLRALFAVVRAILFLPSRILSFGSGRG